MASEAILQVLDSIQGSVFLAILSTIGNLEPYYPDLNQAKIDVFRQGDPIFVVMSSENNAPHPQTLNGIWLDSKQAIRAQDIEAMRLDSAPIQSIGHIHGSSYPFIKLALELFQKNNLNLIDYKIEILRELDSIFVIFTDKNRQEGTIGSIGKLGFEVEIDAKKFTVVRSNFLR